jgi:uncharacterized membrane protein
MQQRSLIPAFVLLAITWLLAIFSFPYLPETVPMHFDLQGNVDRYGSRAEIFILPTIATVVMILLGAVQSVNGKYYNYPVKITPENQLIQEKIARQLLSFISTAVMLVMTEALCISLSFARPDWFTFPFAILWISLLALFVGLIYFVRKSFKHK